MSFLAVDHRRLTFRVWYSCTTTFRCAITMRHGTSGNGREAPAKVPLRLAKDREVVGDSLLSPSVGFKAVLVSICQLSDIRDGGAHIREAVDVSAPGQSKTASCSMRSRVCSRVWLNPPVVTTCTGHPSRSSKSACNAARSKRLGPSAMSTSTSRSLSGPESPRATDPKMRTLRAPCAAAARLISSRCWRSFSRLGAGPVGRGYGSG